MRGFQPVLPLLFLAPLGALAGNSAKGWEPLKQCILNKSKQPWIFLAGPDLDSAYGVILGARVVPGPSGTGPILPLAPASRLVIAPDGCLELFVRRETPGAGWGVFSCGLADQAGHTAFNGILTIDDNLIGFHADRGSARGVDSAKVTLGQNGILLQDEASGPSVPGRSYNIPDVD